MTSTLAVVSNSCILCVHLRVIQGSQQGWVVHSLSFVKWGANVIGADRGSASTQNLVSHLPHLLPSHKNQARTKVNPSISKVPHNRHCSRITQQGMTAFVADVCTLVICPICVFSSSATMTNSLTSQPSAFLFTKCLSHCDELNLSKTWANLPTDRVHCRREGLCVQTKMTIWKSSNQTECFSDST